jgi:hypothetical protein
MPIKDTFEYVARFDSVGLDCSFCKHFEGPVEWPDKDRVVRCSLHNLSLTMQLGKTGYKDGEWFCKDYDDHGKAFPKAVSHFKSIQSMLQSGVLYGLYSDTGYLKEVKFEDFPNKAS